MTALSLSLSLQNFKIRLTKSLCEASVPDDAAHVVANAGLPPRGKGRGVGKLPTGVGVVGHSEPVIFIDLKKLRKLYRTVGFYTFWTTATRNASALSGPIPLATRTRNSPDPRKKK